MNRKATVPDDVRGSDVSSEILKLLRENRLNVVTDIFNNLYDTRLLPKVVKSNEYVSISLMGHIFKIWQVIHKTLEEKISRTWYEFRNGLGTGEAIFGIQVFVQKCHK